MPDETLVDTPVSPSPAPAGEAGESPAPVEAKSNSPACTHPRGDAANMPNHICRNSSAQS